MSERREGQEIHLLERLIRLAELQLAELRRIRKDEDKEGEEPATGGTISQLK
jgi:hypothetical protein